MNKMQARVALLWAVMLCLGVMSGAVWGDTIVQFNFNNSVLGGSEPINSIQIQLFDDQAPITVANFLQYVNNHLYDNTIIHRSVADFVIQGGGFTPTVNESNEVTALNAITNYGTIQNEFSSTRSNVRGTVAMAKMGGDPNSASNQWFVNVADNSGTPPDGLDYQNGGFTVFGQVLGDGMILVDMANTLTTYDLSSYYGSTFNQVPLFNYSPDASNFVTISSAMVVHNWKGGGSSGTSNWGLAANWEPSSSAPNGAGINLNFGSQNTANNVVDMSASGRTAGNLYFSTATGIAIKSSSNYALTLDNSGITSTIDVFGEHTIGAPIVLHNDVSISGGGTLNLSGGISGTHELEILGGTVTAKNAHLNRLSLAPGAKLCIQSKATVAEWKGRSSGGPVNWGVAANWSSSSGVPDGVGSNLILGAQGAANILDMASTGRTVSNIYFSPNMSTTIQGDSVSLKLDNGHNTSTISVLGDHAISAPVIINNDLLISGGGTLHLSGGLSGAHGMDLLNGTVIAKSISLNHLSIGSGGKLIINPADVSASENEITPIPEPSVLLLFALGVLGLLAWERRILR